MGRDREKLDDEGGHLAQGSVFVRNQKFQDRVVAETRAFLAADLEWILQASLPRERGCSRTRSSRKHPKETP